MPTLLGATALRVGSAPVSSIYLGGVKLWPATSSAVVMPATETFFYQPFNTSGLGSGWASAGTVWENTGTGRIQPAGNTGTTSAATYTADTPSNSADGSIGGAIRMWRSSQRGNATFRVGCTSNAGGESEGIYFVLPFGGSETLLAIRQYTGAGIPPVVLDDVPYTDGALITAVRIQQKVYVQIEGSAPKVYNLSPYSVVGRYCGMSANTSSPRWQLDDFTVLKVSETSSTRMTNSNLAPSPTLTTSA